MVNSKIIRRIAGGAVLLAAGAAHAQVLIEDTDKPGNAGPQAGQAAPTDARTRAVRDSQSRLEQGVMQSSERQTGTQQTGMEDARIDKGSIEAGVAQSATTQSGATQAGATQSGDMQAGSRKGDPSNVPPASQRSREAQDARSGVTPESMSGRSGTAGTGAAGGGALNRADSRALMDMAMANMAEVEMGKLAQSKGSSEQVKSFGQQMIDDHGKALAEVQALAQAKGVALPAALDDKHRRAADRLGALSGAAFDKAYMERAGVRDHQAVHARLGKIASSAKDPDVRALATRMKPVVQQHLNSARQMGKSRTTSKPDTASGNR